MSLQRQNGFTIVELLIVIVVIAVLAVISIVAYNGIQQRARDSQRLQDVKTITNALEMYYVDNGEYPVSFCGSSCPANKKINAYWATTSDGSWSILESQLVPKYLSSLPKDPRASVDGAPGIERGANYDYVLLNVGTYCGATKANQEYLLTYSLEGQPQRTQITGCSSGTQMPLYTGSEYGVSK